MLAIQLGELGVAGELGIKHQGGLDAPMDLLPEGKETEHLIIGLGPPNVGGAVEHQFGLRILGKEREGSFHHLSPCPGPVSFQLGFISIMRYGVKVQIYDLSVIQLQFLTLPHERCLKPTKMHRVKGVGIGGHGRALGNDIEPGKQTDRGVEGIIAT